MLEVHHNTSPQAERSDVFDTEWLLILCKRVRFLAGGWPCRSPLEMAVGHDVIGPSFSLMDVVFFT